MVNQCAGVPAPRGLIKQLYGSLLSEKDDGPADPEWDARPSDASGSIKNCPSSGGSSAKKAGRLGILGQCWLNGGPASATPPHHSTSTGPTSRVHQDVRNIVLGCAYIKKRGRDAKRDILYCFFLHAR